MKSLNIVRLTTVERLTTLKGLQHSSVDFKFTFDILSTDFLFFAEKRISNADSLWHSLNLSLLLPSQVAVLKGG